MQPIQPLHKRRTPAGDSPYLIGMVDHYLCSPIVMSLQFILFYLFRPDSIAPHAILHRSYPEITLLVHRKAGHHRIDFHWQANKLL